jgi:hypothetical protein
MEHLFTTPDTLAAAEPIARFVAKKLNFDELHTVSMTSSQDLQRAAAHAAVEAAAWSIDLTPETADILAESPAVRAEVLRLLDLEADDLDDPLSFAAKTAKGRLEFATSVRNNGRLYAALSELAPDMASIVDRLTSSLH